MKAFLFSLVIGSSITAFAQSTDYVSQVWVADQGDGTYRNPVLYADYSDPDAIRVGDDFYLTSSSFGCLPGLQILHSKDLVNWTIIGSCRPQCPYSYGTAYRIRLGSTATVCGHRAIRHHNGEFYIFWGDPDQGAFMAKAKDAERSVERAWFLLKPGKGNHRHYARCGMRTDVCTWLHAYAGSRAGLKSVIAVCELNADATRTPPLRRVSYFDGHEAHETCEGPKFYKRNGLLLYLSSGRWSTDRLASSATL